MRLPTASTEYQRLGPGQKNPLGLRSCYELAAEFMELEDETWISAACSAYPRRECVMPEDCHHKRHGPKEEAE